MALDSSSCWLPYCLFASWLVLSWLLNFVYSFISIPLMVIPRIFFINNRDIFYDIFFYVIMFLQRGLTSVSATFPNMGLSTCEDIIGQASMTIFSGGGGGIPVSVLGWHAISVVHSFDPEEISKIWLSGCDIAKLSLSQSKFNRVYPTSCSQH